eukprot:gnl/MRDRNA2_/MRDRNA2_66285_c0_seq2.p1 gnl/MRDRNA2_/MRDRNA2_66285_c0~~gnl/MRDRNA2_/MRDRNA2_66285_c0_seq2.p1  ORF type:complete len:259 (+),score=37.13 gnl/MRDRNA2_/MRDRNA2_66285_c0_seq2:96-872(+)
MQKRPFVHWNSLLRTWELTNDQAGLDIDAVSEDELRFEDGDEDVAVNVNERSIGFYQNASQQQSFHFGYRAFPDGAVWPYGPTAVRANGLAAPREPPPLLNFSSQISELEFNDTASHEMGEQIWFDLSTRLPPLEAKVAPSQRCKPSSVKPNRNVADTDGHLDTKSYRSSISTKPQIASKQGSVVTEVSQLKSKLEVMRKSTKGFAQQCKELERLCTEVPICETPLVSRSFSHHGVAIAESRRQLDRLRTTNHECSTC